MRPFESVVGGSQVPELGPTGKVGYLTGKTGKCKSSEASSWSLHAILRVRSPRPESGHQPQKKRHSLLRKGQSSSGQRSHPRVF